MPNELKKITALPSGTPADTDVVPFVDLATNTTKKALKSELKGDKGAAATVDAGTTTTLAAGQSATVTNIGTPSAAIFNFAIPQGIQGLTGANGACVVSVSFVGNDMVFVLDDASTVTLTNAKTDLKGDTGAKIVSGAFVGDDLVFTLNDSSTATVLNAKADLKGEQGIQGIQGIQGVAGTNGTNGTNGISFIWEDAYVAETTYQANDVVSYNGSTYICILESTGNLPTNATYWSLMAQKGTDGAGSGDISGSGTANELAYFTAEKTIDNLAVATYPNLTELSYVKGVSSAIQTQLNGKQATGSYEVTTNKETSALDTSTTKYPCNNVVKTAVEAKASLTGTETLTNKRITPRVISATSYTTDTGTSLNADNCDVFRVTAQAGALLFNAPGGTPTDGQKLIISVASSTTTARALTWNAIFEASTTALPTTTAATTAQLNIGFIYSTPRTKWVCVASC